MVKAGSSKEEVKRGPWSEQEDEILRGYVRQNGERNWNCVSVETGLRRTGKSCRMRWTNHLRPNLKKCHFSPQEQETLIGLHRRFGNMWSRIALMMPGRTDNEIKNFWHARTKRLNKLGLSVYHPVVQSFIPALPNEAPLSTSSAGSNQLSITDSVPGLGTAHRHLSFQTFSHNPFLIDQPNNLSFTGFGHDLQYSTPYNTSASALSVSNQLNTHLSEQNSVPTLVSCSVSLTGQDMSVSSMSTTPSFVQIGVHDTNFIPSASSNYTDIPPHQNPYFSSSAGTSNGGLVRSMQTPPHQNLGFSSDIGNHGGLTGYMQASQLPNPNYSVDVGSSSNSMGLNNINFGNSGFMAEEENVFLDCISTGSFEADCLIYDPVKGSITCSKQAAMDKGKGKVDMINISSGENIKAAGNKMDDVNASKSSDGSKSKAIMEEWDDIETLDDNLMTLLESFSSPPQPPSLEAINGGFGLHGDKAQLGQNGEPSE